MAAAVALARVEPTESEQIKWGYIFSVHRAQIVRLCSRILGDWDAAEDATQETFKNAWRARDGFRAESNIKTWLTRIAMNVCLMKFRDSKHFSLEQFGEITIGDETICLTADMMFSSDISQDELLARKNFWGMLDEFMEELPEIYRQAVQLSCIEGFSTKEMMAILRIKESATKNRIMRGRLMLAKLLRRKGYCSFKDAPW